MVLSFIDNVTTGTSSLALFVWNSAPVVCIASLTWTGGLALGLPAIAGVIDISDTIHSSDHDKSIPIWQLINGKSRDLQKLLKYFNGTTISAFNIFLLFHIFFGVPPIYFVIYSKDLLAIVLLLFTLIRAAFFSFAQSFISSL